MPRTDAERANIREGMCLASARRLARCFPDLTPEQLILCVDPAYDDRDVVRLAGLLAARIAKAAEPEPAWPPPPTGKGRPTPSRISQDDCGRKRRVFRNEKGSG